MLKDENILTNKDIYSKILYAFYQLDGSCVFNCELPFIMDEETFIKLIDFYGGKSISIPTRRDIISIAKALDLIDKGKTPTQRQKHIKEFYDKLVNIKDKENEI